jgi:acetyl esterase/lipase
MNRHSRHRIVIAMALTCAATLTQAQMAPELAEKIKAIGPVINPPATAPLYVPRMSSREPYAGVTVQRDINYGDDERHLLDIFMPENKSAKPRGVFMFVHGGAFVRGDRRSPPGSPFYDNLMLWAVQNDMIGVNLTYRLAPKHPWPAGAQDVGLAVAWVHKNIGVRGGDPAKVFLAGHSAGAIHVATYIAQQQFQQIGGPGVVGALMLSALYDISPALMAAEGGNTAYYGADPSLWAERSSARGLLRAPVPLWIGYAELDPAIFRSQAEEMNKALCEVGRCPTFVRFPGHSHMSEIYSVHSDDRQIGDAMLAFIKAH